MAKQYTGMYKEFYNLFLQHLKTLNYSKGTVSASELNVKDYLNFIEVNGITLKEANTETLQYYFQSLERKTNAKTGTGLSFNYLKKIKAILQLFYDFLNKAFEKESFPVPTFPQIKGVKKLPTVLTKEEVQFLFKACDKSLLGYRNQTLLALYYGCGLRRQEATNLNLEDIDLSRNSIFIRQSKTHRQRFVILSENTQKILEHYIFNVRELLIDSEKTESAFLVTERGERISVFTAVYIFQNLVNTCSSAALKAKKPSLHTLRHSIATHLLQSGMKLENISLFLGHRSMDSTQIYTHLATK